MYASDPYWGEKAASFLYHLGFEPPELITRDGSEETPVYDRPGGSVVRICRQPGQSRVHDGELSGFLSPQRQSLLPPGTDPDRGKFSFLQQAVPRSEFRVFLPGFQHQGPFHDIKQCLGTDSRMVSGEPEKQWNTMGVRASCLRRSRVSWLASRI